MSKKVRTETEQIIRAREEGAPWWKIKQDLKVPEKKAKAVIKEHAPYVYGAVPKVMNAWRMGQMRQRGMTVPQIMKETGFSKNLVYSALHIADCIEARRAGERLPGKPCWVS